MHTHTGINDCFPLMSPEALDAGERGWRNGTDEHVMEAQDTCGS